MKKHIVLLMLTVFLCMAVNAEADLWLDAPRGLVYDTDLDITWLQDAHNGYVGTWGAAFNWADGLIYEGYSDWRLPISVQSCDYNCTSSEMGHLYYDELGNPAGGPPTNNGPFIDLAFEYPWYWTSNAGDRNNFDWSRGKQDYSSPSGQNVWAVRDGNSGITAPVAPEPISSTLFIVGGATLGFRHFRKKFKK